MPVTILVGAQWGDEGKGRVADWLAEDHTVVARYAGGDNAGHTVKVGSKLFKLHQVPSGIVRGRMCILGNGMVINPINLAREIQELAAMGVKVDPQQLVISDRAHIITPANIALDKASERERGDGAIGTTLRGIGPTYLAKASRAGIRAGQMRDTEAFADALCAQIEATNERLRSVGLDTLDSQERASAYAEAARFLTPFIRDTFDVMARCLQNNTRVLCEGAQGTMLDIDHGDYPYVTSSSPTAGGALTGLGFGPRYVDRVVGVAKCFSTRVGGGPMPTELGGELAARLRGTGENFWDEFGTTTGRPRRCGWLDAVVLRYAAVVNGFTELVLTKLDVLSGFDELHIAVAYDVDGERWYYPPSSVTELQRAVPVYETFAGWHEDISGARRWNDLPDAARHYIEAVAALCNTPVSAISVGPERDQLVLR